MNQVKNNKHKVRINPSEIFQILLDVEFGVLSKDCENFGICRVEDKSYIELLSKPESLRIKQGGLSIFSLSVDGKSELAFPKSKLDPNTAEKYFGAGKFIVQEDFSHLFKYGLIETPILFSIKKGVYDVKETLGFYIIEI